MLVAMSPPGIVHLIVSSNQFIQRGFLSVVFCCIETKQEARAYKHWPSFHALLAIVQVFLVLKCLNNFMMYLPDTGCFLSLQS